MHKNLVSLAAALLLLFAVVLEAPAAQDGYLDYVSMAVEAVETGKYDQAVQEIDKAFALDVNEPLAHTVLATVFAHTNKVDAAVKEYRAALSLQDGYPPAVYGLALCSLAKGKITEAQMSLNRLDASAGGAGGIGPERAYLQALDGSFALTDEISKTSDDLLTAQLSAQALFKRGEPGKSEEAMKALISKIYKAGYYEQFGAVITFNKAAAVKFTAPALTKDYSPPKLMDASLPQISGKVTLRADLSKAEGIRYVLFFVDNRMVAMVNHPPYEYEWDTLTVANGPHSVKIEGHSEQGLVLSDKSTRVRVANAKPRIGGAIEGSKAEELVSRLWKCMKLKPSLAAACYTLGKLALEKKDKQSARDWFEKTMAVNPDYQDVRQQLIILEGKSSGYREIWSVPEAGKVIALTFDDGPNGDTQKLLDILKDKGIKATFFVVGTRAEEHPEIIKKMVEAGHDIQNHTYTHRNLERIPASEIEKEIFKTNAVIKDITGKRPVYFRCPHGRLNGLVGEVADKYGFTGVFWTINCSKFEGSVPMNIINYVVAKADNGGIVLMHNVEDITLMALPGVIDGLKARGFKFATISEMLSRR